MKCRRCRVRQRRASDESRRPAISSWQNNMFPRVLGAFLLSGLLLSACAGIPRRGPPVGPDASAIVPGFPAEIRWIASTRHDVELRSPALLRQVQRAADGGPVNVLVLSGGGAGGD